MKSTLLKTTFGLLTLGSLSLATTGALASWNHDDYGRHAFRQSQQFSQQIDARQDRQLERIRAGKHAGRLTRAEFRELMQEQREISAMKQHFHADGIIDPREFRRLEHALDRAGRNIRAEKHDRQERHAYNTSPWQD